MSKTRPRLLLSAGAIWLGIAVAVCWRHGWSAPGTDIRTVTGSIIYWLMYTGMWLLLWACVLTALFYIGRGIYRGARRLFVR